MEEKDVSSCFTYWENKILFLHIEYKKTESLQVMHVTVGKDLLIWDMSCLSGSSAVIKHLSYYFLGNI